MLITKHKKDTWNEINNIAANEKWDIIAICEMGWYGGIQGKSLSGYSLYQAQRTPLMKKGGGLALMTKTKIPSFHIQPPRNEAENDAAKSEILWIGIRMKQVTLAIGLIYLPQVQTLNNGHNTYIKPSMKT